MLICEYPHTDLRIALFARRNGVYDRPIVGDLIDFRLEDIQLPKEMLLNAIGPLPDVSETGQVGKYILISLGHLEGRLLDKAEAEELLETGAYRILPGGYGGIRWWEWAVVFDKYGNYIKAPKRPRHGEPSPEQIDEVLDKFPRNRGTLHVLSPITIMKMSRGEIKEDYRRRLDAIRPGPI